MRVGRVVSVRSGWVTGSLAILVAISSGCGDEKAAPSDASAPRGSIEAAPAPKGPEGDPLAGLPVTSLKDVLASWPVVDGEPLVVADLASGRVDSFADADTAALEGVTFTPDGSLVYVDGPSSLAVVTGDGERRSVRLDGEIDEIFSVEMIGERIVLRPSPQSGSEELVALSADGSAICTGPAQPFGALVAGGWAWFDNLGSRLDPVSCEVERGLDVSNDPSEASPLIAALRVDGEDVFVAGDTSVSRFDLGSGRLEGRSEEPMDLVMDMVVRDQELWVIDGTELIVLDAETLEASRRVELGVCDGTASFVEAGGSVYVLDDCTGTLTMLEDATGEPAAAWDLPSDGESDSMMRPVVAGPNIWMVNGEQSMEPIVFNTAMERFERLPDDVRSDVGTGAWHLAVTPAT